MEEVEKIVPVAPSPLDAYRGRGKHKSKTDIEVPNTIVLSMPPESKRRKKKPVQQNRISIVATDVLVSFS